MTAHRKYNWPELIALFEQSDLSQKKFCLEQNINPKYFSQKRKTAMRESAFPSDFIKVHTPAQSDVDKAQWRIQIGRCDIHCPANTSPASIAVLVQQLA